MPNDLFSSLTAPAHPARIGIGGWTYAPWRDNFYPARLPQRRELEYTSRQLNAIEVNGTYYGAQKPGFTPGGARKLRRDSYFP